MKFVSPLLMFLSLFSSVLAASWSEIVDHRRQLAALQKCLAAVTFLSPLNTPSDDEVRRAYESARAEVIGIVGRDFQVRSDAAEQLFGNWSVERIEHLNAIDFLGRRPFHFDGRAYLTMEDASRFLPEGWQHIPRLVELLQKIVAKRFAAHFPREDFPNVMKALGDFSEPRIRHFSRIVHGEWKNCPVSREDLCLYLDPWRMDSQLEHFFKRIMFNRAVRMLGTDDEGLAWLAFGGFQPDRVVYLRNKMLNDWLHRPPTMDELTAGLSQEACSNESLLLVLERFRIKCFAIHKLTTVLEPSLAALLTMQGPPSSDALLEETLWRMGNVPFRTVIHSYIHAKDKIDFLLSAKDEDELNTRAAMIIAEGARTEPFSEAELDAVIHSLKRELDEEVQL